MLPRMTSDRRSAPFSRQCASTNDVKPSVYSRPMRKVYKYTKLKRRAIVRCNRGLFKTQKSPDYSYVINGLIPPHIISSYDSGRNQRPSGPELMFPSVKSFSKTESERMSYYQLSISQSHDVLPHFQWGRRQLSQLMSFSEIIMTNKYGTSWDKILFYFQR